MADLLAARAAMHAALSDPNRLRIVDALGLSDRSSSELAATLGLSTSLLAHHLDILEAVGIVQRVDSDADRRRRYVQLRSDHLDRLAVPTPQVPGSVLFVCTHNSARSQLAAALWTERVGTLAASAGTEPADAVHPRAVAAARRVGLDISSARPSPITAAPTDIQVVTVCDRAHEELDPDDQWWHWSISDPADVDSDDAFDAVVDELDRRLRSYTSPATTTREASATGAPS